MTEPWKNEIKPTPFSEEEGCVISKRDPCAIWFGTKIMYSGVAFSGDLTTGGDTGDGQGSGFNYWSGESDLETVTCSGWGHIRIPELNQLHKIFVFPKDPRYHARPDYMYHHAGFPLSGTPGSGLGGCSGKVALLHWKDECASGGGPGGYCSGFWACSGGSFNSGLVDVIAFGSEF